MGHRLRAPHPQMMIHLPSHLLCLEEMPTGMATKLARIYYGEYIVVSSITVTITVVVVLQTNHCILMVRVRVFCGDSFRSPSFIITRAEQRRSSIEDGSHSSSSDADRQDRGGSKRIYSRCGQLKIGNRLLIIYMYLKVQRKQIF